MTYFGVQDDGVALAGMAHASDSKHCRRCGAPYVYDAVYMGHLGRYHCPNGDGPRPAARRVGDATSSLDGTRGARFTLHVGGEQARVALPLPGLYNVYNALGAAALTHALGAGLDAIVAGLQATQAAFGRAETVRVGGRELAILLVKNPAGANEVLRTLALDAGEHDVFAVLNDRTADGHDVSWVWDADFEFIADRVRRVTCSGTRAAELALRLKYAGVPRRAPARRARRSRPGLDAALAAGEGRLVALPTYTAMLDLRELLVARGAAEGSFAMTTQVIWHDVECGALRRRPAAVARARRRRAGGPVLDVGAGTGRVTLDLARARPPRRRARPRAGVPRRAARARRRRCPSRPSSATPAASRCSARGASGSIIAPMQTIQLLGAAGRAGFLRSARDAPGARRPASPARSPRDMEPFDARRTSCCRCPTWRSSTARATPASRSRCATPATGWRSSASATIVDRDRRAQRERRRHPPRQGRRRRRSRPRRAPLGLWPRAARVIAADRGARRHDGGDAPWLSCASARCIRTS